MNIINSINVKKMSNIYYKHKNTISNLKKTVQAEKKIIQNSKKNIHNQKIQTLKNINTQNQNFNKITLENDLININHSIINDINQINKNPNFCNISALIGHNVLIPGSKIFYVKNTNIVYGYFLPKYTTSLLIQIKDQNNKLIFSHLINKQRSGNYIYYWNGEVDHVCNLHAGLYNLFIHAENEKGSFFVQPLVHGVVKSIEKCPDSNKYKINLGIMGKVNIQDIKRIF